MQNEFLDSAPVVHGNICLGLQFSCYGAFYRRCGYDGTLLAQALNGSKCECCSRTVRDTELGEVYSESATARMAYLADENNRPGIWVLVEVPMDNETQTALDAHKLASTLNIKPTE